MSNNIAFMIEVLEMVQDTSWTKKKKMIATLKKNRNAISKLNV